MDTKKFYAVIKEARGVKKNFPERQINRKTHEEYMRLGKRVLNDKDLLREARTANSYYKRLTAYNYCIEYSIKSLLDRQNREQKEKDQMWVSTVKRLEKALQEFKTAQKLKKEKPVTFDPKGSKRKHMRGLPQQWVAQYWQNVPKNGKYAPIIALLIISGVRPCEVEKGVELNFNKNKNVLVTTIFGAKCRKDGSTGQRERVIAFDCDGLQEENPEIFLKQYFQRHTDNENSGVRIKAKPNALYNYVSRLSRKIWPRHKNHITPYSFRHMLAAKLKKSSFFDDAEVAKILGHASCRSQLEYGSIQQGGSSGSSILAVRAEKEPRPVKGTKTKPMRS